MKHCYRVGILSQSAIADDPRVRRQGDALSAAGWDVVALGLQGARSAPPAWRIVLESEAQNLPSPPRMPEVSYRTRGLRALGVSALARIGQTGLLTPYEASLIGVRVDPKRAETVFWTMNGVFWNFLALGAMEKVDLWLGNDWTSLPIIARLAKASGVPYVYDTHELCADEFHEDKRWRFIQRPIRLETEGAFIHGAQAVSTVSKTIAERLHGMHGLRRMPLVIRSTPAYEEHPLRQTGSRIRVLYHGAVWQHRGLEACIRSVAQWRPEFDLTIRGPVSDAYRAELEREIDEAGVRGRVVLAPAVPMIDLVREATAFDVGLFALPGHSNHNRYALPNKFFEYTMAGLALCVSDLPEMGALVNQYELGTLMTGIDPGSIAVAVNGLTPAKIDVFKKNALSTARLLCWERESERMITAYEGIVEKNMSAES